MGNPATTRLVALLGDPVSHSLSPRIHNLAFQALGINMAYVAIRVAPSFLESAVTSLRELNFAGANVTIPHKQVVASFLDEVSDTANEIGAVNTITLGRTDPGDPIRTTGDNTDVSGFLTPLEAYRPSLRGGNCLIWGTGGAAQAIAYAAVRTLGVGCITLVARSAEQAGVLARNIHDWSESNEDATIVEIIEWESAGASVLESADLLVNATPLGMTPAEDFSPCLDPDGFRTGQIIYDLVYNPTRTRLLEQSLTAGATAIGGLDMLISQAAASFHAWTGVDFPEKLVRQDLTEFFL